MKNIIKHDIVLHASTTASSLSAMLEQSRRCTHDTSRHVRTRTHVVLVVSWRDETRRSLA